MAIGRVYLCPSFANWDFGGRNRLPTCSFSNQGYLLRLLFLTVGLIPKNGDDRGVVNRAINRPRVSDARFHFVSLGFPIGVLHGDVCLLHVFVQGAWGDNVCPYVSIEKELDLSVGERTGYRG